MESIQNGKLHYRSRFPDLHSSTPTLKPGLQARTLKRVSRQRGQALVPVIFVMVILTALAVGFATSTHRQLQTSANFAAQTQRFYAARGAANYAMMALSQTSNCGATYGIVPQVSDADTNGWWQMGDAWVKIDVIDTGAFINLNSVSLAVLQQLPVFQTNTELAQAIIDWRTPTPGATGSGTSSSTATSTSPEAGYYEGLSTPYEPKGAPFDNVDELLLVEYMTPTILYGTPAGTAATDLSTTTNVTTTTGQTRQAGAARPAATTAGAATSTDFSSIYNGSTIPLAQLFTTVAQERNVAADGTPRVNINTANAQALQTTGMSAALANNIITFRQNQAATTGAGTAPTAARTPATATSIRSVEESRQATTPRPSTSSSGAASTGTSTAKAKTGATGAATQTFTSIADLIQVRGFNRTILQGIADALTVNTNTYRSNVVNINTAPQEVLATVPGMDQTILDAIQQYRQGNQAFQSMDDFFGLTTIQSAEFRAVVPYLTTKTSNYYVHIKVRTPGQQGLYAVTAMVNLTDNGPQIMQWRETPRAPGWSTWVTAPQLPTPAPPTFGSTSTSGQ